MTGYRPDLPDFGVYSQWPAPGHSWIHPHDIAVASRLIPSGRVFERVRYDGTHYHLHYGRIRLRVRPSMWLRVPSPDVRVGDRVELLSHFGRFEPGIATVTEIFAKGEHAALEFFVRRRGMTLPQPLSRDQFRLVSVRHKLRSPTFFHPLPKFLPPADMELLNVGDLS
ncbi:MAG: DUF6960 family protein [Aureliella sp.]